MPCHREYLHCYGPGTLQPGPHSFFFNEPALIEYASGCYVLDHQLGGTLQEDHEENVPMGFAAAAPKCSKLSPWGGGGNAQHAWFPHEPTQAY